VFATQLMVFVLGPVLLALWLDHRLATRRPTSATGLAVVALPAMALCALVGRPLESAVLAVTAGHAALMLCVAATLAILTYGFLAGLWLVRIGAEFASRLVP
jgi:hypothetical protein